MKKTSTFLSFLLICTGSFAQLFSDDFESYNVGSYLGLQSTEWTTWSNADGGAEDVLVSNANASSGTKSLYFSSSAASGGPQDVVLPFGQIYNSGNFTFEADFFVESGKGAYFNLQGTLVAGQVWAMDCYMVNTGALKLSNQGTPYLSTTYPTAAWFTMRIEMDLTTNIWELFIDNVSQGTFSNPTGQIGILDLYPVNPTAEGGNNLSGFYVDDVMYNHVPAALPGLNGGVTLVNQLSNIAGLNSDVSATVRNLGTTAITSFDIEYDYNGTNFQESVSGLNLASLATYDHTFSNQVLVAAGSNTLTVTISNVNGAGPDADPADDAKSITIDPIVPAAGKVVVGEEGTGTWCGWCPRGAVFMDIYEEEYAQYWAGIAVHNGDPMTVATYDAGMAALISGYPSSLVDRGGEVDPSAMSTQFYTRLQTAPTAFISNASTWNSATRELSVTVSANFQGSANSSWKLACVLTEDGVTGTTSGYNQTNYYAGGSNGVMGGYELLPNPVPAAQMVYDHVARAIEPAFDGDASSFPATVNSGETHSRTYNFTLPADWNENNMYVIGMLINPSGVIDNAGKSTIFSNSGLNEMVEANAVHLYPNPTGSLSFIQLNESKSVELNVGVYDLNGKQISTRAYGVVNGDSKIPLNTLALESGIYLVKIQIDSNIQTLRLVVE